MTFSWLPPDTRFQLIDVGARGDFHDVFAPIQSQTEVIAFEPDREEAARMSASLAQSLWQKATVLPHAVGHTQSNRDFHLFQMREFSSLLLPNPSVLRGKTGVVERTIQLDTIGLDDLYLQGTLPQTIDFIKVDTQGSELEILQSSEARILPHLLGIETEVEFVEAYQNQSLFGIMQRTREGHRTSKTAGNLCALRFMVSGARSCYAVRARYSCTNPSRLRQSQDNVAPMERGATARFHLGVAERRSHTARPSGTARDACDTSEWL